MRSWVSNVYSVRSCILSEAWPGMSGKNADQNWQMAGEEGHFCARSSFLELLTIFFKFIFGFAGVFVAEHWLSLVAVSRCYSSLQYKNFLLQWLLLQSIDSRHTDSVVVTCRPKNAWAPVVATHGLQLLHGMWNLPRPGTKPMSPTLASRFLSTVP